jgi:hypothetical protein
MIFIDFNMCFSFPSTVVSVPWRSKRTIQQVLDQKDDDCRKQIRIGETLQVFIVLNGYCCNICEKSISPQGNLESLAFSHHLAACGACGTGG